jgi:hypothetical protein
MLMNEKNYAIQKPQPQSVIFKREKQVGGPKSQQVGRRADRQTDKETDFWLG